MLKKRKRKLNRTEEFKLIEKCIPGAKNYL